MDQNLTLVGSHEFSRGQVMCANGLQILLKNECRRETRIRFCLFEKCIYLKIN